MTTNRHGRPMALLAGLLLAAAPASAAVPDGMLVQYRYEGQPFEWADEGPGSTPRPLTVEYRLRAYVLFEDELPPLSTLTFTMRETVPGLYGYGVTVASQWNPYWDDFWSPHDRNRFDTAVTLTTGADRRIVAWSFNVNYASPGATDDTYTFWDGLHGQDGSRSVPNGAGLLPSRRYVSDKPGAWTFGYTALPVAYPVPPPIPVVPEPGTGALFGLGLLLAGWRARRAAAFAGATAPFRCAAG